MRSGLLTPSSRPHLQPPRFRPWGFVLPGPPLDWPGLHVRGEPRPGHRPCVADAPRFPADVLSEPSVSEPTLQDIITRLDRLEKRLEPALKFYVQATGVLSVVKWVGIAGVVSVVYMLAGGPRP